MVLWLCSTLLLKRSKMIRSKMLALYMCTIDGDCGGSGGGGGGGGLVGGGRDMESSTFENL